jgi:hypothetical protein
VKKATSAMLRSDDEPIQSASRAKYVTKIMTRAPYRGAVGARVETGAQWGILVAGIQTREDRATTGVVDSPLTRLVLVRRAVISGGFARAGRRPR